jgi:hypothetical protein
MGVSEFIKFVEVTLFYCAAFCYCGSQHSWPTEESSFDFRYGKAFTSAVASTQPSV